MVQDKKMNQDKKKTTKTKQPKNKTESEPVVDNVEKPKEVEENDNVLLEQTLKNFAVLTEMISECQHQLSKLRNEVKTVEKSVSKDIKVLDKVQAKKRKNKGTRAPSGIVKPTKISDELAAFLSKSKGTLMARTDVTKEVTQYIREYKLQDKDNGRKIIPDKKLKALLKLDDSTELTYFNLQKYMSPHFEKSVA
jgi:chromatin remodeling complex protein RSC6